ncbi:hypothetical protein P7C71_g5418, partial [Lecanoromycetidae sp. Uapishka_2]
MANFFWDRLGVNMDIVDGIDISSRIDSQSADKAQATAKQGQSLQGRIPQNLLWSRFDAKLDHCNKVVKARESCLRASGCSEATIYHVKDNEKKLRMPGSEVKGAAATLRDRIQKIKGAQKSGPTIRGTEVISEPAKDDGKDVELAEKPMSRVAAMRESILQIKRADSVRRNSAYRQTKQRKLSGNPRLVKVEQVDG